MIVTDNVVYIEYQDYEGNVRVAYLDAHEANELLLALRRILGK